MQVFVMSLIGMIFIILSPVWSYWTATGGVLMLIVGVVFILIATDVDQEKYNKEEKIRLMKLERDRKIKELREATMRKQQEEPEKITNPIVEKKEPVAPSDF